MLSILFSAPQPQQKSLEAKPTLAEAANSSLEAKGSSFNGWLLLLIFGTLVSNVTFYAFTHFDTFALTATTSTFTCAIPELEAANWSLAKIRNISLASDGGCEFYAFDYRKLANLSFNDALDYVIGVDEEPEVKTCAQLGGHWVFEGAESYTNYDSEWQLVCEKEAVAVNLSLAFFIGSIFGGLVLGLLGDWFGRKAVFKISIAPLIIAGFATAFAPSPTVYWLSRFVAGFFGFGISNTFFVFLVENCEGRCREVVAIVYNLAYAIGLFVLSGIVNVTHDTRQAAIVLAVMGIGALCVVRFLSESQRFLLARGDHERVFKSLNGNDSNANDFLSSDNNKDNTHEINGDQKNFLQLLTIKHLLVCVALYSLWCLAFNLTDMNVTLLADDFPSRSRILVSYELLGYAAVLALMLLVPRRHLLCMALLVFGSLTILTAALPSDSAKISQAMLELCRCFLNPVAGVLSLCVVETFATNVRNTAYGLVSSFGYVATLYSSDLVDAYTRLEDELQLPTLMTVFGLACILACALVQLLPETKHRKWKDADELDGRNRQKSHVGGGEKCFERTLKIISLSALLLAVIVMILFACFAFQ